MNEAIENDTELFDLREISSQSVYDVHIGYGRLQ